MEDSCFRSSVHIRWLRWLEIASTQLVKTISTVVSNLSEMSEWSDKIINNILFTRSSEQDWTVSSWARCWWCSSLILVRNVRSKLPISQSDLAPRGSLLSSITSSLTMWRDSGRFSKRVVVNKGKCLKTGFTESMHRFLHFETCILILPSCTSPSLPSSST